MKIDYVAWAVMFIALAGLFWNVNTGFNRVHERIDRLQAETNARFDAHQAETGRRFEAVNARFDEMQAEMNRLRAEMNRRFDTSQAENQRQHDAIVEVLRVFEGRITRLEENAGIGAEGAE
ncbi:MAG: hypothetical protein OXP66_10660 [Candidatus Tectomicrobia bacterium]|nr:hypothetical protein [Candidatus Tectomicrobia bacterium]